MNAPRRLAVCGLVAVLAAVIFAVPSSGRPLLQFGRPVQLTKPEAGGFEPGIAVDRFGNVYVTAHKDRYINAAGPDSQTPVGVRGASYVWTSPDGVHFHDLTPDEPYVYQVADEGDLDVSPDGHLYFVDTNVVDSTFTSWTIHGRGKQRFDMTRPAIPSGQPVDDRPWVAGGNEGTVLYTTNNGAWPAYPAGDISSGDGTGPGRYTVYVSHDHGATFDSRGITLKDSGWCYPAADKRPGSKLLYVVCVDIDVPGQAFDHALYSYVSRDDGATWSRYLITHWKNATWPSVSVGADGTVYASIGDFRHGHGLPRVFVSHDEGRTWSERDVPWKGRAIPYSWMDVAPNGTIGVGFYSRPNNTSPWFVYAAESAADAPFEVGEVSSTPIATKEGFPEGDFFQVAFGPTDELNVVWTSNLAELAGIPGSDGDDPQIFYARQS
jgi:hypothetical protein